MVVCVVIGKCARKDSHKQDTCIFEYYGTLQKLQFLASQLCAKYRIQDSRCKSLDDLV